MQRNKSLLMDMANACRQILKFTEKMDFEAFAKDQKTQSAVIHQFLIIGEVSKLLSEDFKKNNPEFPWSAMARMRDKLIHHYRGVDLKEIWKSANSEIPPLFDFLAKSIDNQ